MKIGLQCLAARKGLHLYTSLLPFCNLCYHSVILLPFCSLCSASIWSAVGLFRRSGLPIWSACSRSAVGGWCIVGVRFSRSWSHFSRFFRDFLKKSFRALKRCFRLFSAFFRTSFARAITTSLKKGRSAPGKIFFKKRLTFSALFDIIHHVSTGNRLTGSSSETARKKFLTSYQRCDRIKSS